MKLNIGVGNVPFIADFQNRHGWDELFDKYLSEKDIQNWEKTPWWHCTQDPQPDEKKRKYTDLGSLRFCEGWLTKPEWEIARAFRTWYWDLKEKGLLTFTKNCEGCKGSFIELTPDEAQYDAYPGYWIVNGQWYFTGIDYKKNRKLPPYPCQWDQYRYNRRLSIQYLVYGRIEEGVPKGQAKVIEKLLKKRR